MSVQRLGQPLITHCTQAPQLGSGIIGVMQFHGAGLAPFSSAQLQRLWDSLLCVAQLRLSAGCRSGIPIPGLTPSRKPERKMSSLIGGGEPFEDCLSFPHSLLHMGRSENS